MKIRVGETTYAPAGMNRLSLRDVLTFENEMASLGRPMTWQAMTELVRSVMVTPREEAETHPDLLWCIAAMIWVARVDSGERVSFTESLDVRIDDFEFIPEEGDDTPRPHKARPASGRAAARRPADHKAKKKVSVKRSSAA